MIRKLSTMAAAVSFAEAGDFDTARELLSELDKGYASRRRKIVMAAKDAPIGPEPLEYALGLAGRLQYDTMFLNILTPQGATPQAATRHAAGFKSLFQNMAQRLWPESQPPIAHSHAVLKGDFRLLLKEACRRLSGVELIIIQKRKVEPCAHGLQVPVFCFDM